MNAPGTLGWQEVLRLHAARDYFGLRDRLDGAEHAGAADALPARFARGLVQHAFNAPAASNATITALLATGRLPDSRAVALRRVQVANQLRLFAYRAGLAAVDTLLADTSRFDPAALTDLRNTRRLFAALVDVPPQTVEVRGPTALRFARGRVPVTVNDSPRHYVFDTGANRSTLMRSEARALGVRVLPAGIDVGSATDRRITADIGVADRLTIGGVHYRHVVFLVLDDRLLTQRNLALDELTPLTRVRWEEAGSGAALLCRLDTGADATQLYEPFYRRFRARVDAGAAATRRRGGAAAPGVSVSYRCACCAACGWRSATQRPCWIPRTW